MAYLNHNCTFLKPSLTLDQVVVETAERPTATITLEYSSGEFEYNVFAGNPVVDIFLWNSLSELPEGTEIKAVKMLVDGEWVTLESLAQKYEVYEWFDKRVKYLERVGSEVLYSLCFIEATGNEFINKLVGGLGSDIEITYYTE